MNLFLIIVCQTYAFAQYSRNWQGTDVPGHIQASFTELHGTQSFKILPSSQKTRFLKYTITRDTGKLTLIIKSDSNILVSKEIIGTVKDSINVVDPGKQMKVSITGQSAAGRFDIKYSQ